MYPKLALAQRGFVITDLIEGGEVTQTSIQLQRMPLTRVRGHPDEEYYLTLQPEAPTVVPHSSHAEATVALNIRQLCSEVGS